MKKTHTKNLLSMAPSLQMFSKHSNQFQQRAPTTIYQADSLVTSSKNPSLKYNRSISSFAQVRKNNRDSPDKKHSGSGNQSTTHIKSRPTLPKGMLQLNPLEKITNIFASEINTISEESLYQDMMDKFNNSINILQNSMQSDVIVRVFKQIRQYSKRIFSIVLKFTEKQLTLCNQQLLVICNEYQGKIKQIEKRQKERIGKQFAHAESEVGKKMQEVYRRALFNTQVFHQMEYENIDMMGWVKESEAMDKLMLSMQDYKLQYEDSASNTNMSSEKVSFPVPAVKGGILDNGPARKKGKEEPGKQKSTMNLSNKKQYTPNKKQHHEFEQSQFEVVGKNRQRTIDVQGGWKSRRLLDKSDTQTNRSN